MTTPTRRLLLGTAMALPALRLAAAQEGPVVIGTLSPLTGAGGSYGPGMRDMAAAVVRQANEAGGIRGRQVRLVAEDDQTNPDAGVRAARKLIDVDRVSAIIGTWASAVTTAVAPLCWESRTFLTTVSGADTITQLPHQGYLIRTQPNSVLQGQAFVRLVRKLDAKKPYYLGPQTPYAEPTIRAMNKSLEPDRVTVSSTIYDPSKPSYRSEVDAALRADPDVILAGGYATDTAVLLRDLYRAGFKGRVVAYGYAVNDKFVADQPKDVTDGVYTMSPAPETGSTAYKAAAALVGKAEIDTYAAQVFDQVNLVLLSMQLAGATTGTAVKDAVRQVSQGDGPKISTLPDGLAALKAGATALDYEGASGPCTFDSIGDILEVEFRFDRVVGGKLVRQDLG